MPTKDGMITVKDVVEDLLGSMDICFIKNETSDYVMDLLDKFVAVPYKDYKRLLEKQEKYDELEKDYNTLHDKCNNEMVV